MDEGTSNNSTGEKCNRRSPNKDRLNDRTEHDHNKRRKRDNSKEQQETMDDGVDSSNSGKKRQETMDDDIGTSNNSNAEGDEEYFATMPPGNKFDPDDHQIVVDYLMPRIKGQPLPRNKIREVNLYKYNPEDLTALYNKREDRAWFFLTSRDRKYANGNRPDRAAGINKPGEGYWKATGSVKDVYDKGGNEVGKRSALVFYRGKPKTGTKTDWIMQEFTANYDNCNSERVKDKNANKMRLDDWVICKVYQKPNKGSKGRRCAVKDNQAKTEESASLPATHVNDHSSVVPESNNSGDSIDLFVDDFQNLSPLGSLSPATLSGFHSGYDINQNLMTTNVDNQSSNHYLHLEAAPNSSTHPSSSLIDSPSQFPGIGFLYNQINPSSMDYLDFLDECYPESFDLNIFESLTPLVPPPLIIHENPPTNNDDKDPLTGNNDGRPSASEKGKRPLIGEDPSSSGQGWTHSEDANRPYIDNNVGGHSSSMQGWTHSEDGNRSNRLYIHNNGEGSSRQGWTHTEDGNRPYHIDNNGGGHRSSGQELTRAEDGNRPYHIHNNGEGSSGQGRRPG